LAGDTSAAFCTLVILGIKIPLVVELTSSFADESGVVVPIPVWAFPLRKTKHKNKMTTDFFIIIKIIIFRIKL
jgi:hypothetical protein